MTTPTTDAAIALLEGWDVEVLNARDILEFTAPNEDGICYVEGNSPSVYTTEGGSGWFCFEETRPVATVLLLRMGFTPDEIKAARESS